MAAIVVPFRGSGGKQRLSGFGEDAHRSIGLVPADAVLILNADVPCVVPYDLRSLLAATPLGGIALVASADGRTNALSLPAPHLFEPLYSPRSAERFQRT